MSTIRLWIVTALLVGLWLLGVLLRVSGRLIHFLLVLAIVLIVLQLTAGRRAR